MNHITSSSLHAFHASVPLHTAAPLESSSSPNDDSKNGGLFWPCEKWEMCDLSQILILS